MREHPVYRNKRRRTQYAGYASLTIGLVGIMLPFLPGIVFLLVGLSILSVQSREMHERFARLRSKYPHLIGPVEHVEMWIAERLSLSTHGHDYVSIPLRHDRQAAALIEVSTIPGTPAVLILHGASGTMETSVPSRVAEAYRRKGCTVVRFDAYDGLGESTGVYTSFSASGYLNDLNDVMSWVRTQSWCDGKVILVGHSIGALVAGWYAAEHADVVSELLLINPTISGEGLCAYFDAADPGLCARWKDEGLREITHPLSGETVTLGFSFVEDAAQYNLQTRSEAFVMPVHVLVGVSHKGEKAPEDCRDFVEALGDQGHLAVMLHMSLKERAGA